MSQGANVGSTPPKRQRQSIRQALTGKRAHLYRLNPLHYVYAIIYARFYSKSSKVIGFEGSTAETP